MLEESFPHKPGEVRRRLREVEYLKVYKKGKDGLGKRCIVFRKKAGAPGGNGIVYLTLMAKSQIEAMLEE